MESVAKCEFCFTKENKRVQGRWGERGRERGREGEERWRERGREKWCWEDNYYPQGENYVKLNFLHIVSFQTQIINVLFYYSY
jgi:hypothetical protein